MGSLRGPVQGLWHRAFLAHPRQHPKVMGEDAPRHRLCPMGKAFGSHRTPEKTLFEDADPRLRLAASSLHLRKFLTLHPLLHLLRSPGADAVENARFLQSFAIGRV